LGSGEDTGRIAADRQGTAIAGSSALRGNELPMASEWQASVTYLDRQQRILGIAEGLVQ
jgi:hypothetical protein